MYDDTKQLKSLEKFRKKVCQYESLKRRFLLAEHVDSTMESSQDMIQRQYEESDSETDLEDDSIDDRYDKLNFKSQHTKYRDFLGKYDEDEFYVDEDLHIFFPPIRTMRPSYTLLFKLVRLSGEVKVSDKVMGWGVFPLINSELKVNEGKFKVPFMYGDGDKYVAKYRDVENAIKGDLDKWLCNMYFEIKPLVLKDTKVDLHRKLVLYKKPIAK